MFHWFKSREDFCAYTKKLEPLRQAAEEFLLEGNGLKGWCGICQQLSAFHIAKSSGGGWCDLRENILCECKLNGRMREVYEAIKIVMDQENEKKFLMFEQVTPFFFKVQERYPNVEGCEFLGDDIPSGSYKIFRGMQVRSENILRLSYSDNSFDLIFHGDVLEHVPDTSTALKECWRILKPGGTMLFTCPFFDLEEHLIRARVVDGQVEHLLPPAYHGNPILKEGSLVFFHHGWPLLNDIRNAGFSQVRIGLLYDVFQGIVSNNNPYPEGHMWPVIFQGCKD